MPSYIQQYNLSTGTWKLRATTDHASLDVPSLSWDASKHTKGATQKTSMVSADFIPFFNSENSDAPEYFTLDDLLKTSRDY